MPTDRPIDGVDASAFLLGQSPTTGRDHVIDYGSDAGSMSVKWRTMKVVFRYSESINGPIIKTQWPLVFDLIEDPVEEIGPDREALDCVGSWGRSPQRWARSSRAWPATPTSSRARSSPDTY